MSDSEVLTVALVGQWRVGVPWCSERGLVRFMQTHGRHWFPTMLQRSQFNARVRRLWGVLVQLQQALATWLRQADEVYVCVDCLPLPACTLAQASSGAQHWLGLSRLGHGGNGCRWYYGDKLLAVVTPHGAITGWLVGSANLNDRWLMEALLSGRTGQPQLVGPPVNTHQPKHGRPDLPDGSLRGFCAVGAWTAQPYLADRNFNSPRWQRHWSTHYQARLLTKPARYDRTRWSRAASRWFSRLRQIVDTVFARLVTVFDVKHLQAHSYWGQLTRIATCCAAYNLGLYLNHLLNRPLGALGTLIC